MIRFFSGSFTAIAGTELKTVLFVLCATIAANVGLYIFNRLCGTAAREENNTVAGIFFATISVLYSLILAFVIMAEWDDYNGLDRTIASENDKLNSILAHSSYLPDSVKATVAHALSQYCEQVVNQEWTMQERTAIDHPSAIPALRNMLLTSSPADKIQENVLRVMDEDLSAISDLRRDRLSHTRSQLPPLVWSILEAGAILLIVFCYFFKATSGRLHKVYISLFVCLLFMCLSIVYNLDHPFASGSGLGTTPYQRLLLELPRYYAGR